MNVEIFSFGLLIASILTGLLTEAIKNLCTERKWNYYANTMAGYCSIVVSVALAIAYVVITGTGVTPQIIIACVALVFMSWLCAMVGYDKVIQAITQIKTYKKEG